MPGRKEREIEEGSGFQKRIVDGKMIEKKVEVRHWKRIRLIGW